VARLSRQFAEVEFATGGQDRGRCLEGAVDESLPSGIDPLFSSTRPSTRSLALHAFLAKPHADMANLKLKADKLDVVVAYLLSLKTK